MTKKRQVYMGWDLSKEYADELRAAGKDPDSFSKMYLQDWPMPNPFPIPEEGCPKPYLVLAYSRRLAEDILRVEHDCEPDQRRMCWPAPDGEMVWLARDDRDLFGKGLGTLFVLYTPHAWSRRLDDTIHCAEDMGWKVVFLPTRRPER